MRAKCASDRVVKGGVLGLAVEGWGNTKRVLGKARCLGLTCLGVSFVFVTLYAIGSVTIFTKFGPAILEAGELSLAITIIVTGLLCVCGLLWITLVILGGCALLAATVVNGFWIYRLR